MTSLEEMLGELCLLVLVSAPLVNCTVPPWLPADDPGRLLHRARNGRGHLVIVGHAP